MKKEMVLFLLCLLLCTTTGCGEQFPAPETAMVACIEAGGNPVYKSTLGSTDFECDFSVKKAKQ